MMSSLRSQSSRWRSIHVEARASGRWSSVSRCVRPWTRRTTTPASSKTRRCLLIAGFETGRSWVVSPTVPEPRARRSTIVRRTGCDSAAKLRSSSVASLTIRLTVAADSEAVAQERLGDEGPVPIADLHLAAMEIALLPDHSRLRGQRVLGRGLYEGDVDVAQIPAAARPSRRGGGRGLHQ